MPLVEVVWRSNWPMGGQTLGPRPMEATCRGALGYASPVRAADGSLDYVVAYGGVVRATVTFALTDETGEPLPPLHRAMDGMVVMIQGSDGAFRVINFVRDGRRLDEFFRVFDGNRERRDGVTVEIRNLVQLERWQFGIEITNDTDRTLRILPNLTALLTKAEEMASSEQPVVTFPSPLAPGESAEGIVSFVAPTTAEELDLQVAVAGPDGERRGFVFGIPPDGGDIDALSHPLLSVPPPPPVDAHVASVGSTFSSRGTCSKETCSKPRGDAPGSAVSGWRCELFTRSGR